jgi:hypothetical protein
VRLRRDLMSVVEPGLRRRALYQEMWVRTDRLNRENPLGYAGLHYTVVAGDFSHPGRRRLSKRTDCLDLR